MCTGCAVILGLLFSRALFELHFSQVEHSARDLVGADFLIRRETQNVQSFLQRLRTVTSRLNLRIMSVWYTQTNIIVFGMSIIHWYQSTEYRCFMRIWPSGFWKYINFFSVSNCHLSILLMTLVKSCQLLDIRTISISYADYLCQSYHTIFKITLPFCVYKHPACPGLLKS